MARREKVNKSAAIRQYKKENPEAKPAEIAAALTDQGIEVTPGRVSTTLYQARNLEKARMVSDVDISVKNIEYAVDFIKKCGSVDTAYQSLEAAAVVAKAFQP